MKEKKQPKLHLNGNDHCAGDLADVRAAHLVGGEPASTFVVKCAGRRPRSTNSIWAAVVVPGTGRACRSSWLQFAGRGTAVDVGQRRRLSPIASPVFRGV
jgi:hypothetical protein